MAKSKGTGAGIQPKTTWKNAFKRDWQLYLLLLFPLAMVFIFNYAAYPGMRLVFMDYKPAKGYAGSEWVGWETFIKVFKDADFSRALKSSIVFNLLDLIVGFPMPIILALMLNELRYPRFKKVTQTILYLPHFLSWVIIGSVAYTMFRPETGLVNIALMNAGLIEKGIPFLTEKYHWAVTYLLVGVWQGMGWGTIIYFAALSGVDPQLYEAASIDGAKRFKQLLHVTVPAIMPTVIIMLILNCNNILNAGFDQIFMLYSAPVYEVADIIDTYVYRIGIQKTSYSFSTAAGMFKSVIALILIVSVNFVAKKSGNEGVW